MSKSSQGVFDRAGFSNVDATGEVSAYVAFLDQAKAQLRELSRARYALLQLRPGDHVLDVGCGMGDDARELAALVGPQGQVVGIDCSEAMVAEARKRSEQSRLPVAFAVGDAQTLDCPDNCFDACWAERVFQHLAEPPRALAEMVRVVKPGGRIVVFEPDHEMLAIDAADPATSRSIVVTLADGIRSGRIGRKLFGLFRAAGLRDVQVIPTPLVSNDLAVTNGMLRLDDAARAAVQRGLVTATAASEWTADLRERQSAGRFFACLLFFAALGRKP